jgi:hypothetical protein
VALFDTSFLRDLVSLLLELASSGKI